MRRLFPLLLIAATSCVSTRFAGELEAPRAQMNGSAGQPVSHVWVDSTQRQVRMVAGPFRIPRTMTDMHGEMEHQQGMRTPMVPFVWPVQGGLQGFALRLYKRDGTPVPRSLLHHLNLLNFDHRELLYPVAARVIAIGADTPDIAVPDGYRVRIEQGDSLGWYIMWNNDTGQDIDGVYVDFSLEYGKAGAPPAPLTTLYIDSNLKVGSPTSFDVPPGRSERSYEWEPPLDGSLVAAGGHMHEYGVEVRLEDAETAKVLFRLKSHRDSSGEAWVDQKVFRRFFNLFDASIKLKAHHPYRIVAVYDNPTSDTIQAGGMAQIGGLFKPDDWGDWPANDPSDELYKLDVSGMPAAMSSEGKDAASP